MKLSISQHSFIGFLILFAGCLQADSNGPADSQRANHIVFDEESELLGVDFEKQTVFMDSLYLDQIHDVDVDDDGTIYMAGEKWNHQEVHKFAVSGDYIGNIGQLGDDPGSFRKAARLQVEASGLWVSDPKLSRISRFTASTGELQESIKLDSLFALSETSNSGKEIEIVPIGLIGQNRLLFTMSGERNPAYQPEWGIQYASITTEKNGRPNLTRLFDGKAQRYMVGDYAGRPAEFTLSINEQPLIAFQTGGLIYVANSADFFIRVFSQDGTLLRTYTYPYERLKLNPEKDIFPLYTYNRQLLMVRESAEYPEFWPALYRMFLDDEQRLWVSTVTEESVMSEWFVIDDRSQTLMARFTWPVDKPIHLVKNGIAYAIEKNSAGFEIVVSYDLTIE